MKPPRFSRQEYSGCVREFKLEEPFDYFFYRPIAYLLVKSTYQFPLTPNHFSIFALIVGLIGGGFFMQGTPLGFIGGGLSVLAFGILDCCDGMLARMKQNSSPLGELIDMLVDVVVSISFYIGIFIGLGKVSNLGFPPYLIILSGISLLIHAGIYNYFKKQLFGYINQSSNGVEDSIKSYQAELDKLEQTNGSFAKKLLIKAYLAFAGIQKSGRAIAKFDSEEYKNTNKLYLALWGGIAGSTHLTLFAFSALMGKIEFYISYAILFSNLWMVITFLGQYKNNSSLKRAF